MAAVNADSIASDKVLFTKRQLAPSVTISRPGLELVDIKKAKFSKDVLKYSDQPLKKRKIIFPPTDDVQVTKANIKPIVWGKGDDVAPSQGLTDGITNTSNYIPSLKTHASKNVYQEQNVIIHSVDNVDSAGLEERDKLIMDIPDQPILKQVQNGVVQKEVTGKVDRTGNSLAKVKHKDIDPVKSIGDERVSMETESGAATSSHQNVNVLEKSSCNLDAIVTLPASKSADVKDRPFSEKVNGVKSKHSVRRSNSCPEGTLFSSWNSTMGDWPLSSKEEIDSFFKHKKSSDANNKGYPSLMEIDKHYEFFRENQSKMLAEFPEEVMKDTKQPFPPYHMIAFGPTPPSTQDTYSPEVQPLNKDTTGHGHQKMKVAVSGEQTDSNVNPLSNLSYSDSEEMDDMVMDVINDCRMADGEVQLQYDQPNKQLVHEINQMTARYYQKMISEGKTGVMPKHQQQTTMMTEYPKSFSRHDLGRMDRRRLTNRIAARKCRMKQQERESQLQHQFLEYENKNTKLNHEVKELMKMKANLEQILINHMHSKTCKLPEKFNVDENLDTKTSATMDIHNKTGKVIPNAAESLHQLERGMGDVNTVGIKSNTSPGLLQRRALSQTPLLPKLKLPKPEEKNQVHGEILNLGSFPNSAPVVTDVKPAKAIISSSVELQFTMVTATPTTVTAMEDDEDFQLVQQDPTDTLKSSLFSDSKQGANQAHIVKMASDKPREENHKKSGRSKTKAQIKKVSAEQLKNILKKGGKLVSAKDKEGKDISVDTVFGDKFKRPFDVKPLVKTPTEGPGSSGAKSGLSDSYQRGIQDATRGKSLVQNPYLYKQAMATYAMKHGLHYSSREQVLAHVKARHKAKETSDRLVISSSSSEVLPGRTVAIPDIRGKPVEAASGSGRHPGATEVGHTTSIVVDPTEPLFAHHPVSRPVTHTKLYTEQNSHVKQSGQTKHVPVMTMQNVVQNNEVLEIPWENAKPIELLPEGSFHIHSPKTVNETLKTGSNKKLQGVSHAVVSTNQHGRLGRQIAGLEQTSPVSTPSGHIVQSSYNLLHKNTTSSNNTQPRVATHRPAVSQQILDSSKTKMEHHQLPVSQPASLITSSRLSPREVPSETSMAVSALLQLKSGFSKKRESETDVTVRTQSTSVPSSVLRPGIMHLPLQLAGQSHPQTVFVHPGTLPMLVSGQNLQNLGHLRALVPQVLTAQRQQHPEVEIAMAAGSSGPQED